MRRSLSTRVLIVTALALMLGALAGHAAPRPAAAQCGLYCLGPNTARPDLRVVSLYAEPYLYARGAYRVVVTVRNEGNAASSRNALTITVSEADPNAWTIAFNDMLPGETRVFSRVWWPVGLHAHWSHRLYAVVRSSVEESNTVNNTMTAWYYR